MIGIQNNSRLNIVSRNRLTLIINHPYPVNEYIRFIYYSYERKTEKLPEDIIEVRKLIQSINLQTNATHIIGETSVGKSTFINAFANYVTYNTLKQDQTSQPMVLIPASFLITVGDNFEERRVKFGDVDSLHDENIDHPAQSVIQHCKSYIFHLNDSD
ncbi:unnamed protein product [Rotaria sordida]|uniref:Uncharacterized protein n=1 Tax=Rotaria sordida TaxID=392033 RepID=A0A819GCK3_9BILA|nr:unnamed protein product [Rotaria sordida]CAF3881121.1 unnamed protein product [Rotaria sordida]